jgi:DNA-binding PadR family transcriptional regulator
MTRAVKQVPPGQRSRASGIVSTGTADSLNAQTGASLNATSAVLLGLLLLGPAPATEGFGERGAMTGWQLHETANASVGAFWNITRSQIYLELDRLAAAGLVDELADGGPRRQRPYRVTSRGRDAFEQWIAELARDEARADQLRSPLTLLVFFGEHMPRPLLRRALQAHRLMRERRLERLQAMLAALDSRDARRLPTAVLQRGIALAKLHLEWIDDVLLLIDDA